MTARLIILWAIHAAATCALGQAPQFDLSSYRLTRTHELFVPEASAVAYNPDRQTLFVIGDGADMIVEFNRFGTGVSMVLLSGFEDTEGITYVGAGRFVIAEERVQGISLLTWPANANPVVTINRSSLPRVTLGPNVGNEGIEGICFDPTTEVYFAVKEKNPQQVLSVSIDFSAEIATAVQQCPTGPLGVNDLADIAVLSNVTRLTNALDRDHLLIISQASARVIETTRSGVVQSSLSMSGISGTAEGITIDEHGVIYIVDETPRLYVFEPCRANFDAINGVGIDDLFGYLNAWFRGCTGQSGAPCEGANADISGGGLAIDDLFLFLYHWFAGC